MGRNIGKLSLLAVLLTFSVGFSISNINQASADPGITLSSTNGVPNSTITVTGSGFGNGTSVSVLLDHLPMVNATTNVSGTFSTAITVPSAVSNGNHIITATDGVNAIDTTFTVILPELKISPSSGIAGTTITVSGSNFGPNRNLNIKIDGLPISTVPANVQSSDAGTFLATINIPSTATAGRHFITVEDGFFAIPTIFDVSAISPSSITLSTTSGPTGTLVTVKGTGFAANSPLIIKFDSTALATTPSNIITGESGSFTAAVTIPTGIAIGTNTISAIDTSGRTASSLFTTIKSGVVSLSSNAGIAGSVITVYGSEFNPNSAITIKLDSTALATANIITTSSGTFTATITVPTGLAIGTNTISAIDASGRVGLAPFTIIKSGVVTLSSATAMAGSTVSISGYEFNPNSPVTIRLDSMTLLTVTTNALGSFNAAVTVPQNTSVGTHPISVTDSSGRPGSAILTIIKSGIITLSSSSGIAGSTMTVYGSEFNPDSPVTIKVDSTIVQPSLPTLITNALGSFNTKISIPENEPVGSHTITVTDLAGRTGLAVFSVREPGFITISPTIGPAGTDVIVNGWNYVNGTKISLKFNSVDVGTYPSEIRGSTLGKFISKFRIPANLTEGTYTITAEDFTGRLGTAFFAVAKDGLSVSMYSNNGKAGTVSVSGWGFDARSLVQISFEGEIMHTTPLKIFTSRTGTFNASFNVPGNAPNGDHTISVISNQKIANTTLTLKRNYIDDRYGALISVVPDKYNFELGETIMISGKVLALNNGFPLLLKVINPNNAACSFQQLSLDKDMNFKAEPVKLAGTVCSVEGEYKITAFYGRGKALTKFSVAGSDNELTGGRAEVLNAQRMLERLKYDNYYTIDLDWASNAVSLRNNVNQTVSFYLMFAEYDADEITKNLSYQEVTLEPFEKDYYVAPFVPQIIDGKPNGYLHVFVWTNLANPEPLHPGLYVPY